jgi:hypothetical protein
LPASFPAPRRKFFLTTAKSDEQEEKKNNRHKHIHAPATKKWQSHPFHRTCIHRTNYHNPRFISATAFRSIRVTFCSTGKNVDKDKPRTNFKSRIKKLRTSNFGRFANFGRYKTKKGGPSYRGEPNVGRREKSDKGGVEKEEHMGR